MKHLMMPNVIAIIVTFNGSKWIDKCFGSLVKSTLPVKIIAIDNASTDGTPDLIRNKFPQVEVIETNQNLGFGKANNIGLNRVLDQDADFAFLLNQDAWIDPATIEKLVNAQKKNPKYDLLSPLQLNSTGDAIDRNFQDYLSPQITPGFLTDATLGKLATIYESKYANAASWFLTRNVLEIIGGFDPLFKHYGEDDDYLLRMHDKGLKLGLVTSSIIFHDRPQNGKLHSTFYRNQSYTLGLQLVKNKRQPRNHFLIRRIISNYFTLYFNFFGNNSNLRHLIKKDIIALKLKRKANHHLKIQEGKRPFLSS